MNKNSELCQYIAAHDNWEEELKEKPYCLKIRHGEGRYKDLCVFCYDHLYSGFSNPIVQEARGIIIDLKKLEVVCWAFNKFFNYGEGNAAEIDWSTARATEKIDGSIMKLWYFEDAGEWVLSTNGMIDAREALVGSPLNTDEKTFYDLFKEVDTIDYSLLDKACTYIFELCSSLSRVVVKWDETVLFHIGTKNNRTGKEFVSDIGIQKPKEFPVASLDDCLKAAKALSPANEAEFGAMEAINPNTLKFEGLVVNDADFNRIKVKSYAYVMTHLIANNNMSDYEIIVICLKGEADEFLSYFPRHTEQMKAYDKKVKSALKTLTELYDTVTDYWEKCGRNKGELGRFLADNKYSKLAFNMILYNRTPVGALMNMPKPALIKLINSFDPG